MGNRRGREPPLRARYATVIPSHSSVSLRVLCASVVQSGSPSLRRAAAAGAEHAGADARAVDEAEDGEAAFAGVGEGAPILAARVEGAVAPELAKGMRHGSTRADPAGVAVD